MTPEQIIKSIISELDKHKGTVADSVCALSYQDVSKQQHERHFDEFVPFDLLVKGFSVSKDDRNKGEYFCFPVMKDRYLDGHNVEYAKNIIAFLELGWKENKTSMSWGVAPSRDFKPV